MGARRAFATFFVGAFMVNEIIGQVISLIAVVIFAISYQVKENRLLIIFQTAGTACFCISYLLFGEMVGFATNIVCIVRNFIIILIPPKTRLSHIMTAILVVVMGVVGMLSWSGPISLLIIIPLMINTVFLSLDNPQLLRKSVVLTSFCLMLYNMTIPSSGGIISEAMSVTSSIVGIIRYRKKPASDANNTTEEISTDINTDQDNSGTEPKDGNTKL